MIRISFINPRPTTAMPAQNGVLSKIANSAETNPQRFLPAPPTIWRSGIWRLILEQVHRRPVRASPLNWDNGLVCRNRKHVRGSPHTTVNESLYYQLDSVFDVKALPAKNGQFRYKSRLAKVIY